jgi:membrane protease YdiL (CAAX protease family)
MTTVKAFIKSYPVLCYFALTFAISWGGFVLVVGRGGIPATAEEFATLMPFVGLALLAGPTVASLLLTGLVDGKAGYRDLLSRLRRWQVGVRWYAVALLIGPLTAAAVGLVLSLLSAEFLPALVVAGDKASVLLGGLAGGLVVGIFEELGWTGFAVQQLLRRHEVLATGLIVGVLWGVWHFLNHFWAGSNMSGELDLTLYLPLILFHAIAERTAYRVLMVWVYDRTNGSLLLAMLMHASFTARLLILGPMATGLPLLIWNYAMAAALWIVVLVVTVASGGHLSRQPLHKEMAVASS